MDSSLTLLSANIRILVRGPSPHLFLLHCMVAKVSVSYTGESLGGASFMHDITAGQLL